MRKATVLLLIAGAISGCNESSTPRPDSISRADTIAREVTVAAADSSPLWLKLEGRKLVAEFIEQDLKGTLKSVGCGNVYKDYVSCTGTWRLEGERLDCQADFNLERSGRSLAIPSATTSYCVASTTN